MEQGRMKIHILSSPYGSEELDVMIFTVDEVKPGVDAMNFVEITYMPQLPDPGVKKTLRLELDDGSGTLRLNSGVRYTFGIRYARKVWSMLISLRWVPA